MHWTQSRAPLLASQDLRQNPSTHCPQSLHTRALVAVHAACSYCMCPHAAPHDLQSRSRVSVQSECWYWSLLHVVQDEHVLVAFVQDEPVVRKLVPSTHVSQSLHTLSETPSQPPSLYLPAGHALHEAHSRFCVPLHALVSY